MTDAGEIEALQQKVVAGRRRLDELRRERAKPNLSPDRERLLGAAIRSKIVVLALRRKAVRQAQRKREAAGSWSQVIRFSRSRASR